MKTLSQRALILFTLLFSSYFLLAQKTLSIYFDSDKYLFKASETPILNAVIDSLSKILAMNNRKDMLLATCTKILYLPSVVS